LCAPLRVGLLQVARQLCRGASLIACRLMAAAVDHPREADAEHLAMLGAAVRTRADGLGFRVEGYLAFGVYLNFGKPSVDQLSIATAMFTSANLPS